MVKDVALIGRGTGLGVEQATKLAAQFEYMGIDAKAAMEYAQGVVETAELMGVNTTKVLKNISDNFKKLQTFTFASIVGDESLIRLFPSINLFFRISVIKPSSQAQPRTAAPLSFSLAISFWIFSISGSLEPILISFLYSGFSFMVLPFYYNLVSPSPIIILHFFIQFYNISPL